MGRVKLKKIAMHYALSGHIKILSNLVLNRLGRKPAFTLSSLKKKACSGALGIPQKYVLKFKKLYRIAFLDTLLGQSIILLLLCILIAIVWGGVGSFPANGDLLVEFWGLIFDVFVILVGFGLIQHWKQKRDDIARQHELIQDFKRWDSNEARHRIVGAVRRLNRMGQTEINLSGAIVKDISFRENSIMSLRGSRFSGSGWINEGYVTSEFTDVDFSGIDCSKAIFEKAAVLGNIIVGPIAQYSDCHFWETDLQNAIFDGASLRWSSPPPKEMGEIVDEDDEGQPIFSRCVAHSFNDANLSQASFKKCKFENADFRYAINIEKADFRGSQGLETCVFDNDGIKARLLAQSIEV